MPQLPRSDRHHKLALITAANAITYSTSLQITLNRQSAICMMFNLLKEYIIEFRNSDWNLSYLFTFIIVIGLHLAWLGRALQHGQSQIKNRNKPPNERYII